MTKTYHIPTAPTSPIRKPRPHLDLRDFGITLVALRLQANAFPGKPSWGETFAVATIYHEPSESACG